MHWKKTTVFLMIAVLFLSACSNEKSQNDKKTSKSSISSSKEEESTEKIPTGIGEGAPSTETLDLEDSKEYKVGDIIKVKEDDISYELVIDKLEYTEKRNEFIPNMDQVLLVTYTYTNLCDEILLIDDMRFQLTTPDGSDLFEPYYFDEIEIPEAIGKGEKCTAQVAYSMSEKGEDFILVYHDTVYSKITPVKILSGKI